MITSKDLANKGGDYADWVGYFDKKEIVESFAQLEIELENLKANDLDLTNYCRTLKAERDALKRKVGEVERVMLAMEDCGTGEMDKWADILRIAIEGGER